MWPGAQVTLRGGALLKTSPNCSSRPMSPSNKTWVCRGLSCRSGVGEQIQATAGPQHRPEAGSVGCCFCLLSREVCGTHRCRIIVLPIDSRISGGPTPARAADTANSGTGLTPTHAHTSGGGLHPRPVHTEYITIYIAQVYMLFTVYISLSTKNTFVGVYKRQS